MVKAKQWLATVSIFCLSLQVEFVLGLEFMSGVENKEGQKIKFCQKQSP